MHYKLLTARVVWTWIYIINRTLQYTVVKYTALLLVDFTVYSYD